MGDLGFVLRWPWSLLDAETRQPLDGQHTVELDTDSALMLALPCNIDLRVRRGRARLEPEGPVFELPNGGFRLQSLPAPRDSRELEIALAGGAVVQQEQLLRHTTAATRDHQRTISAAGTPPGHPIVDLGELVAMIELLLQVAERLPWGPERLLWNDVASAWLSERREAEDAHRALIVSHAETLEGLLVGLAERPRRVLVRRRRLTPVARVQELDRACIGWYVRQPGVTTEEKAGPRQRVLAVVREESRDTLENRVLHQALRLSVRAALDYVEANERFRGRPRLELVRRYGRICRTLALELATVGVGTVVGLPTPSYPLLFDARYRRVWQAYRELLRAEEVIDEAWRWQRRLWADIVRIATLTALTRPEVQQAGRSWVAAQSPLQLRREQARGRWSEPVPDLIRVLLKTPVGDVVIEPIDVGALAGQSRREAALAREQVLSALGAPLLLRLERVTDGRVGWIAVWAVWGSDPIGLEAMRASFARALRLATELCALETGSRPRLAGIAIVAAPPKSSSDFATNENGWSLVLPIDERGFADGIYLLRGAVDHWVTELLGP